MAYKPGNLDRFWEELKRRKVTRTITVYATIAFVILQITDLVADPLNLPGWTRGFVIVLICIGFLIAVFLSWVYDVTPSGVKKTKSASLSRRNNITYQKPTLIWKIATYTGLVMLMALTAFNIYSRKNTGDISKLEKSVAVLPFRNDSPSDTNTYFINGIMEKILNNLQMVKELRVISRTSVEQYRNSDKSIPEIAKEQNVNFIIEGSGQKYGNKFVVTVQLIKAIREDHLWARSYMQEITTPADIIKVQSNIAQSIASELKATITPGEKTQMEKVPTGNITSYDLYQRGRDEFSKYWINNDNKEALNRAGIYYRRALRYDPAFAEAYVGQAEIYWYKNYYIEQFSENLLDSVLILADIALSIDDKLAAAHYIKGCYYGTKGIRDAAIKEFDRAAEINPNDWLAYEGKALIYSDGDPVNAIINLHKAAAINHGAELPTLLRFIGGELLITGNIEEARSYFRQAFELDGDSAVWYSCLGGIESNQGNYDRSIEFYQKAYNLRNTYTDVLYNIAKDYLFNGQHKESLRFYKEYIAQQTRKGETINRELHRIGYAYWKNGNQKEAEKYFEKQIEYSKKSIELNRPDARMLLVYYDLAGVYAFRGDRTNAYQNLRIYNQKQTCELWMLTSIKNDPLFEEMRDEPEFIQIVSEMEKKYQLVHENVRKILGKQNSSK